MSAEIAIIDPKVILKNMPAVKTSGRHALSNNMICRNYFVVVGSNFMTSPASNGSLAFEPSRASAVMK